MLRILHLEDSDDDAFFIKKALNRHGVNADFAVVKNRAEFAAALEEHPCDLILADNGLPGFNGLEALQMARQKYPDIGFICVSGAAAEEQVSTSLNAGATDYVIKDQTWQLVVSVRREIERLRLLRISRGMTRLLKAVHDLSLARDLNTIMNIVRLAARELTGADGATFVLRDGECCFYADEDAIAPLWKGQRFPLKACISGWVMLNGQPAVIEDIYADERIPADAYRPTFVQSLAMVPIRGDAPLGAIGNYWAARHQPTPEEVELLQALANTTAVAMENVRVYHDLEGRVKERTAQLHTANLELKSANRELESFSYAVSHDLGAPLRRIRNFVQMMQEDCGAVLQDNGHDYLERIQSGVGQMQALMDDLLRLAKVTRAELNLEPVNLSALAQEITRGLSAQSPERKVEVRITEGMEAQGDRGLLRIVLQNLFSNAWKYTLKREQAQIEFSLVTQPDGLSAFCIRDNGAGFAMENASQLFQPFQRLHTQDEYPGSGIGLTTVQRIIQRHGGTVWAEAKVNEGAAFYFTLATLR